MTHRIPTLGEITPTSARSWMDQMIESRLFFHPDDDPSDIAFAPDLKSTFGEVEVAVLRNTVGRVFATLGDQVYEIVCDTLGIAGRAGPA